MLFLIYVNDMVEYLGKYGILFMYADDTTIIVSASTQEETISKLETALSLFMKWCFYNKLKVNINKTACIGFSYGTRNPQTISIQTDDGQIINLVEKATFLGTVIDSKLTFSDHIDLVCIKLKKLHYLFLNLTNYLDKNALLSVYYAKVYSAFSYNIIVWGQSTEACRVFTLQKRVIRRIYNLKFNESCRDTFRNNRLLTFVSVYLLKILVYIHKHRLVLKRNRDNHEYSTRSGDNLYLPKCHHSKFKKSVQYAGCYLYNVLSPDIKNITNTNTFKNVLKDLLIVKCCYTIQEYLNVI
ncbi:hypothetical protein PPYR_02265 [Photinus pyralis]|uniref:Reverse transcriptase domain-containing protein n=1 Tax=Photinus pyralis TaxID=7054 RepID=A0A5N4B6S3_PHOPY|nr:hypothetical protein PPYR_02265 [Photinus pyralis]